MFGDTRCVDVSQNTFFSAEELLLFLHSSVDVTWKNYLSWPFALEKTPNTKQGGGGVARAIGDAPLIRAKCW
jgi:hypothetical protein